MMKKQLPDGWQICKVEEIAILIRGISYKKEQARNSEELGYKPILRANNINGELNFDSLVYVPEELINKNQYICKNDIVFAMSSGSKHLVGKSAHAKRDFDGSYGAFCGLVRAMDGICKKYLYYAFQERRFRTLINEASKGSNINNLKREHILDFEVFLPPLNEQKRIVAKIEELFSELDNGIAALKTAREQLKVYRQAILKHAFEGKLTAKWREGNTDKLETQEQLLTRIQQERDAHYQQQLEEWKAAVKKSEAKDNVRKKPSKPRPLKTWGPLPGNVMAELPDLPNSWYWSRLGNLTTGVEYGTSAKSSESGFVPVIRMGNLQNGKIDWSDLVYTSDEDEIEKYLLTTNDVLFNRTNSPELVGKTSKYRGEQPALFAGYLIRINQIDSIVVSDYLNYFLNCHIAKQYGNTVKTDGVNQSNINGEKLQNYPFPFCSILEQSKIIEILEEKLSITDSTIVDIESQLSKAETLRQSILKKAFSGNLVPQDPNDEPASELLERIKVEKEQQKAPAKKSASKPNRKKIREEV